MIQQAAEKDRCWSRMGVNLNKFLLNNVLNITVCLFYENNRKAGKRPLSPWKKISKQRIKLTECFTRKCWK
jgi:hypothetical protein